MSEANNAPRRYIPLQAINDKTGESHPATGIIHINALAINAYSNNGQELNVSEIIPAALQKYSIPGTKPVVISGRFGHFLFQEFHHRDGEPFVRYSHYIMDEEHLFNFRSEQAELRLQLELSNNFYLDMEGIGKWKISQGTYNFLFVPFLDTRVILKPGRIYNTLNVYFQFEHLISLGLCNQPLSDFLEKVKLGQASLLHTANQPITFTMERIVNEILTSPAKGSIQPIYLENKIKDLLISCFDPENEIRSRECWDNDKIEVERIYEAKQIWLENIQTPLSLALLSKKTGLNIKKIKLGFKKVFDQSPYNLLLNARMEMAERLLSESDKSVSEISDAVGYFGVQSFSKAFKLFFKESPLQYRKKTRFS